MKQVNQKYRDLFVWAVFFCRIPMAMIFWKEFPDQLGSALVASLMFKSLAREAKYADKLQLSDELDANAGSVICCCYYISAWMSSDL